MKKKKKKEAIVWFKATGIATLYNEETTFGRRRDE
jgi:hypothetical protein